MAGIHECEREQSCHLVSLRKDAKWDHAWVRELPQSQFAEKLGSGNWTS